MKVDELVGYTPVEEFDQEGVVTVPVAGLVSPVLKVEVDDGVGTV